jgi:hypothetical protein
VNLGAEEAQEEQFMEMMLKQLEEEQQEAPRPKK